MSNSPPIIGEEEEKIIPGWKKIARHPKICGGDARLKGTRYTIAGLVAHLWSYSPEEILEFMNRKAKLKITMEDLEEMITYAIKRLSR